MVDLRNPWGMQERLLEPLASPLYYLHEQHFERKTLATAALAVSNTEPAGRALAAANPVYFPVPDRSQRL